jgi:hypothetical protein
MKLPEKLYVPAAIVAGSALLAVGLAFAFSPPEGRTAIIAGIGVVWGFVQTFLPALLSGGKAEE